MILTVTINPLLEKRLFFKTVELGTANRSKKELFYAGGKGINVSRQLNLLGQLTSAVTFLGGNNGKILRHCMSEDKIEFAAVPTKSETRMASVIIEENGPRISTFFGINSQIASEEAEEFKERLARMIHNCSIVIFSGSSPCAAADGIFPFGIELANRLDKISILDTYGNHLSACIEAGPTVIHNNVNELEKSFGVSLREEKDKIELLGKLFERNIKLIFLTDGKNPAYAAKYDFIFRIDPLQVKEVDPTGSGDAFVAGIAYGLEESIDFESFLKTAVSLGAANARMIETCAVLREEIKEYIDSVKIVPIGKKMKTIDDSPNY
jgi:1-phosphofructokinase family hexose kinase